MTAADYNRGVAAAIVQATDPTAGGICHCGHVRAFHGEAFAGKDAGVCGAPGCACLLHHVRFLEIRESEAVPLDYFGTLLCVGCLRSGYESVGDRSSGTLFA